MFGHANLRRLLSDVEERSVLVDTRRGCLPGPVRHEAFRRNDALLDTFRRSRPLAAYAQDAIASVRILDPQDHISVGSFARGADQVNERPGLKRREFPIHKSRHGVSAVSRRRRTLECFPGSASCDGTGRLPACRRDERPGTCELDLPTRVSAREGDTAWTKGGGGRRKID